MISQMLKILLFGGVGLDLSSVCWHMRESDVGILGHIMPLYRAHC